MKKMYRIIMLALITAILISAVVFLTSDLIGEKEQFTSQGVIEEVKAIQELNTVEMYFSEIIDFKDALIIKKLQIPFTEKSFIFTVKARVKAGVDLSRIASSDVKITGKQLILRIPQPVVTSKEILSYTAYSEKDGLFNPVTNEDTLKALELFTQDLEKQAIENGIVEKARENAETVIAAWFKGLGYEKVLVQWY